MFHNYSIMKIFSKITFLLLFFSIFISCGVYNFTGAGKIDAKTFQVNYFQNIAEIIEPGIERDFTLKLQELIQNQTNLSLTNTNGDLVYEGEIVGFNVSPMSATADLNAAQNRLTITINVRFENKSKPEDNFEKRYSFFKDYEGTQQPVGAELKSYINTIYQRITQDIFNDSLAKW